MRDWALNPIIYLASHQSWLPSARLGELTHSSHCPWPLAAMQHGLLNAAMESQTGKLDVPSKRITMVKRFSTRTAMPHCYNAK